MKKTAVLTAVTVLFFCVTAAMNISAQSPTGSSKILIAYFSLPETDGVDTVSSASRVVVDGRVTGNVEFVANCIQKATGGDMFAIRTVQPYPGSHQPLLETARHELNTNARPPLAAHISDVQNYDTIFVGYPIWWYDMPMPLYRFLDEYSFTGITIIPFITHGGAGFSGTVEKIIRAEPEARVIKEGLAVSRNNVARSERDITAWLRGLGMLR